MGHFYAKDGTPVYEVPYADLNKGMRDTTLSDAKKLGLYKSVTTVLDVPDKPALWRWKLDQIKLAVLTVPQKMDDGYWWQNVIEESEKIGKNSAARGAELHDALEQYYKGDLTLKTQSEHFEFIGPVIEFMNSKFPNVEWVSEASFASPSLRVGGKVDLYSPEGIVLDFKTKATSDIKKMVAYEGHHMQTAAYAYGLFENKKFSSAKMVPKRVKRYNLFISTEEPNLLNLTESVDYDRDIEMFMALNTYWDLKNGMR